MEIKNDKKKKLTMIVIITLAVLLVVGGTYAAWSIFYTSDANVITSGQASMKFKETNEIEINNALPMNDNDGKVQTNYFDFSVSTYVKTRANDNTGQKTTYNVIAEPLAIDTTTYIAFTNDEIKVYLTKVEEGIETQVLAPTTIEDLNSYLLETHEEEFKNNKQEVITNYRLRTWVDFNVDASNWNAQAQRHSYKFRVNINGEASSNVKLTGITIQTPPTKTTYVEGKTFDTTGMVIIGNYNDGTTQPITDYTISPDRALQQTDTGITITYQGKVVTQNIRVGSRIAVQNIMSKVGTDGLVEITHPADNTLQLGSSSPITEYRYQGRNGCQGVTMTQEICTLLGEATLDEGLCSGGWNYYITSNLNPAQCTQYGGTYNNNIINNYVSFNGEDRDYRIIGVFPTEDTEGNITNRIKLIKTTSYGDYAWNDTTSTNRWGEASLKETLNNTYYNSLTNKGLIDNVKYYLGGYNDENFTNETMYQYERKISGSTYYYSENPTSWTGQIGLMYYSDYMYGSADCNGKVGFNWDDSSLDTSACITTNWLYLESSEWTITEYSTYSDYSYYAGAVGYSNEGCVYNDSFWVRPVFYLSSDTIITGGTGTIDDPYTFGAA